MKYTACLFSFLLLIVFSPSHVVLAYDDFGIPIEITVRYSFIVTSNGLQVIDSNNNIVAAVEAQEEGPFDMQISGDEANVYLENKEGIRYTIDISSPHRPVIIDKIDPRFDTKDMDQKALDDFDYEAFDDLFPISDSKYSYSGFEQAIYELGRIKIEVHNMTAADDKGKKRSVQPYKMVRKVDGFITDEYISDNYSGPQDIGRQEVKIIDFGNFCDTGNYDRDIREFCAFLSYISFQTAGGDPEYLRRDGLVFLKEKDGESKREYATLGTLTGAEINLQVNAGEHYYGRGAGQLKYAYNYALFSFVFYGDMRDLLDDPDMVAEDPVLAFASAIFSWVFGIKYDVEPGKLEKQLAEMSNYYKSYCDYFGVASTEKEAEEYIVSRAKMGSHLIK